MFNFSFCNSYCNHSLPPINKASGEHISFYYENLALFWTFASVCILIAILAVLGNGLVISVSHETRSTGRLRYLDNVVKSLAVTDFLFGLVGTAIVITGHYLGE